MKQRRNTAPVSRRIRKRRSRAYSNTVVKAANRMINTVRRWFMRKSYASAVCLGIATFLALAIVCVFAIPMPQNTQATPAISEIAVARTEVPAESAAPSDSSAIYDELKATNAGDTVSAIIYDKEENASNITVYAAEDAECYHTGDCKFAFASSKRLTAYEAYYLHYRPCGRCNPPVYNPVTGLSS